jgi:hypothetical protein
VKRPAARQLDEWRARSPVLRAGASLLSASYLDEAPTRGECDRWRGEAVDARLERDGLTTEVAALTAERDEAVAALERLTSAARVVWGHRISLEAGVFAEHGSGVEGRLQLSRQVSEWEALEAVLDATPSDLAASQRREWRASGMEAAADLVEQRLAERCAELRVAGGCAGYMRLDDTLRRCPECLVDLDPAAELRDMAKRERGA